MLGNILQFEQFELPSRHRIAASRVESPCLGNGPSLRPKKAKSAATPRRRPTVRKVAYTVKWDPIRRRFIALGDSGILLGLSAVQGLAMGIDEGCQA